MLYYIINFDLIYSRILENIKNFCNKFELDFFNLKIKTKKEIIIYYSLLEIIKILNKNKTEKPIIIYNNIENIEIFKKSLKEVSKLISIPIIHIQDEISIGLQKELFSKADCFYNKNEFTIKKFSKLALKYNLKKELNEKIKNIKLPVISH